MKHSFAKKCTSALLAATLAFSPVTAYADDWDYFPDAMHSSGNGLTSGTAAYEGMQQLIANGWWDAALFSLFTGWSADIDSNGNRIYTIDWEQWSFNIRSVGDWMAEIRMLLNNMYHDLFDFEDGMGGLGYHLAVISHFLTDGSEGSNFWSFNDGTGGFGYYMRMLANGVKQLVDKDYNPGELPDSMPDLSNIEDKLDTTNAILAGISGDLALTNAILATDFLTGLYDGLQGSDGEQLTELVATKFPFSLIKIFTGFLSVFEVEQGSLSTLKVNVDVQGIQFDLGMNDTAEQLLQPIAAITYYGIPLIFALGLCLNFRRFIWVGAENE